MAILRSVGTIVLSLAAAFALVVAVEALSAVLHPFPPGFEGSHEEIVEHVKKYPDWVLAVAAAAWGATTLIASWLATRLGTGRHPAHGYGVGLLLLVAVCFNMYLLPYPIWFEVANLVIFPIGIYWGTRLGRGGTSPRGNRNSAP